MKRRWLALVYLFAGAAIGGCIGWTTSFIAHVNPKPERFPFLAERVRPPHHVPAFAGGVSLRLAMVHDVLHERYPKHSTAWYEARNQNTLERLRSLSDDDPSRWPLVDDLAVGLDRLGQPSDGIPLLREKWKQQQAASISGIELYSTYANLGTLLIHANLNSAIEDDAIALRAVDEGIDLIRKSVNVNPTAHFGRERWQASIAEFLRATCDHPTLLTKFDCIGNRLDLNIERMLHREENWTDTRYGRTNFVEFTQQGRAHQDHAAFFDPDVDHSDPQRWKELAPIREFVTRVGAERDWKQSANVPSHQRPIAFDEPVMGIIGMWRQGGGANPHFALALGETMLRVGQRYIAWNAFERASLMAKRYSPDHEIQKFLIAHCADRQAAIEGTLRFIAPDDPQRTSPPWQYVSLPPEPAVVDELRATFQTEHTAGLNWQNDRQAYETMRLDAGGSTEDEDFFDEYDGNETMASPVGLEESVLLVRKPVLDAYTRQQNQASAVLGIGIGAMVVALSTVFRHRRRNRY